MIGFAGKALKLLTSRADAARDERRFEAAAALYQEALRFAPARPGLHIQLAHMLKETGRFAEAEQHYDEAGRLRPGDADLALQKGHLYKVSGRLPEARRAYERAIELQPGWDVPTQELKQLTQRLFQGLPDNLATIVRNEIEQEGSRSNGASTDLTAAAVARLVPELEPAPFDQRRRDYGIGLEVRRFGRPEHGFWGNARTLRGVEAIRGVCHSPRPIVEVQLLINGLAVYRGPVKGGYPFPNERHPGNLLKYVFNIWVDFGRFSAGRYGAEVRCIDTEAEIHAFHDDVVVGEPLNFESHMDIDSVIPVSEPDPGRLEAAIRRLPSVVRSARRPVLADEFKSVLIMRTDQLGDVIASTPAVRRLRELLPDARFVGLLTASNADMARTLNLFDDIVVIDFPDDKVERRRLMPLTEQEALRARLSAYAFDLAIDLSQSDVSRPLLLLSGASFLYGVEASHHPWMTAEFSLNTHDRRSRLDIVPHSAKVLAQIEALGALLRPSFKTERRPDLDREQLERLGLLSDARYVVLHMGARIEFSRWPHFPELAARILAAGSHRVVMMTEDPSVRATLPPGLAADPRFHLIDERMPFDDFDTFVSFADVLVGNDSGPKHLASVRGIHVVTLFTARINWLEWAQEEVGTVISRRVPCAGCTIFHDAEECGKDFTCIRDIAVDEVFTAMKLDSFTIIEESVA